MSLNLGSLTSTATNKLKSSIVGKAPTIDNKKITSLEDIKKIGSKLKKSAKALPTDCIKNKTNSGSGKKGGKWNYSSKLPCEPLVDNPTIKKVLETNKGFDDLKNMSDKKAIDLIITKATDKLNSTTIPAIGRTSLNKLNESDCNPFSGMEFPNLNLPNIHLPHLGINSLLHDISNGAMGILNSVAGGIGSALNGMVSCGPVPNVTNKSLGLASVSNNIKTTDGILKGLSDSGKLDLGITNNFNSDDTFNSILTDTVAVTNTSKLNLETASTTNDVNSIFNTVTNNRTIKDITNNENLLATAKTASILDTDINSSAMTSSKKISVFSKVNKEKMNLVA